MTRLLAAAILTIIAAIPAFACDYEKSVSNAAQSKTVASQPANDRAPSSTVSNHRPS